MARQQPKGGSRKGIPNKASKELKDMIRAALDKAGGENYLYQQSLENPTAFLTLVGKILPKDMNITADSTINIILNKPGD